MKTFEVVITFIRDILGSQPSSSKIKEEYITAKMMTGKTGMSAEVALEQVKGEIANLEKDENYLQTIKDLNEKSFTVFYRNDEGKPCLSDVQIRGFMKDAFAFTAKENKLLTKKDGEVYSGEEKYRKHIGERISFPVQYYPMSGSIDLLDRPIRCKTMQGDRVSIASSERIKAGGTITVVINVTDDIDLKVMKLIFDRGMFKGISQWSNAQYGTFTYKIKEIE